MTTGKYQVLMKSGRKYMVEQWSDNDIPSGNIKHTINRTHKVLVKDAGIINQTDTKFRNQIGLKNIALMSFGSSTLNILNLLDNSGVERIEEEHVIL